MRTVQATRYVTPLREGGSLPAVIEADDDGMYVLKFRGAGQGPKALVAEWIAGELARALGLPVPELVAVELHDELALAEPDSEIQDLMRASLGVNLGMDYLPRSISFDPAVERPDAALASAIVWFDAFVMNVDRTARNTNLLVWHRAITLIDHGAALYFHHDWDSATERVTGRFPQVKDHVLLPYATQLAAVDERLSGLVTRALLEAIVEALPDDWLQDAFFADADANRAGYVSHLLRRLESRAGFVEEAVHAHAGCV
jgi:hypothetical protein